MSQGQSFVFVCCFFLTAPPVLPWKSCLCLSDLSCHPLLPNGQAWPSDLTFGYFWCDLTWNATGLDLHSISISVVSWPASPSGEAAARHGNCQCRCAWSRPTKSSQTFMDFRLHSLKFVQFCACAFFCRAVEAAGATGSVSMPRPYPENHFSQKNNQTHIVLKRLQPEGAQTNNHTEGNWSHIYMPYSQLVAVMCWGPAWEIEGHAPSLWRRH